MLEGMMVYTWVSLNVHRQMKFTTLIDESVKKKSSKHGGFKILPWTCKKKILGTKIYTYFFVIIPFTWTSSKALKEVISFSFAFKYDICIKKHPKLL